MSFSMWFREWIGARPPRVAASGVFNHAARLSVRKLEDRRVLSVSAAFSGGVLDIAIDNSFTNPVHIDATDDVAITVDNSTHQVLVNTKPIDLGGGTFLLAANVTGITLHDTANANNSIDLSGVSTGTGFNHAGGVTVQLSTGGGNDTITGSAFSDVISAGSGNNTISGGGGDDTFQFSTGFHTNTVSNTSGTNNTLDLSSVTSSLTVNLQTHTATAGSGSISFTASDIDSIIGGTNANNSFQGLNAASDWTIGAASNTYASGSVTVSFSQFKTLQGGSGNDIFDFNANSTFTVHGGGGTNSFNLADGITAGSLIGDSGTNTLSYAAYSSSVTVNLLTSNATNISSISGFDNVTGGTGNDTLTGDNNANVLDGGGGLDTLAGNGWADTLINGYNSTGGSGTDLIRITSSLLVTNGSPITLTAESILLSANLSTVGGASAGDITLTGAVTLGSNVTISTNNVSPSTDGDVTFSSTIDSDGTSRPLTIDTGSGNLAVTGAIGGTAPLASLQITSANQVDFHADVTAKGSVTQLAGTSHTAFDSGVTSQNGSVTITTSGAISVGTDVSAPGSGAGGITLTSTAGTVTVGGNLSTSLTNGISISSLGDTSLNGSVTATNGSISITSSGSIDVADGISAGGGTTGDVTLSAAGTGSVTMSTSTTNNVIARDVTIQSGSGGIGSATQALRINASSITATTAGNADIYVSDVGTALTIASGGLNAGVGTIHLTSGQFSLGGSDRIVDTSTVVVASGAQLLLQGFNESIATLNLESGTSSGSTVTTGLGTLTLLGNISLTATGTGATGALISGKLSLGNATRTVSVANGSAANDLTISASMSGTAGTAGLTKVGAGVLLLSGNNTYAGTTTVSAGTLAISGGNAIANTGAVSVTASTTFSLRSNETIGTLSGLGSVTNSAVSGSAVSLTVTGGGTYDGAMADGTGPLALVVNGAGTTLTLTGANTNTGSITITSGTLQLDGSVTSDVSIAATGTLSGSGTVTGDVTNLGTLVPGQMSITGDLTSSGTIQFTANSGWTTAGTDYTQLVVGGNVNLSGSHLIVLNTLDASAPTTNQLLTLISHTGSSNKTTTNGSTSPIDGATLTVGTHAFKLFYNGGDGNDVVLIEASVPSVVYVSSSSWSSLTNGTTISDADFGAPLNQPAILGLNAFTTVNAALAASSASSQVIVNAGTYHEAVSLLGTHTLTITPSAAVTFDSLSTIAGTVVQIQGVSLTVGNGTNTTVAGDIIGTGNFAKSGTGTLILSGSNTYTGTTTISAGTLQIDGSVTSNVSVGASGTLSGSGTITGRVTNQGTFAPVQMTIIGDLTSSGAMKFTVNSGWTIVGTDYSQVTVGGNIDLSNSTLSIVNTKDLSSPLVNQLLTLINHAGSANKTITNGSTSPLDGATLAVGSHSFKLFFNGGDGNDLVIVEATAPSVVYVSNTAWTGMTGGTTIADADFGNALNQPAILGVNAFSSVASALAASATSGQVIVNAGTYHEAASVLGTRTLAVTAGAAVSIDSLSAVVGTFVQIQGTSLTIGDNTNTTIAGPISGAGNLVKVGSGTVTLSGTNVYVGTTTITAGTLQLAGSIASNVAVGTSGTLSGSGTVTGNVTNLGVLAPVVLTITGDLISSGSVQFKVNSGWTVVGTDYSQLTVGGNLDLSNSALTVLNTKDLSAPSINQLLTLINHTGAATNITNGGTSPVDGATLAVGSRSFKLFLNGGDGNDVVLVEASLPNVVYVSNTAWTGFSGGTTIADADTGTPLNQPAIFGVNAFTSVSAALASSKSSGQIIVNAGTYHESVNVVGTRTLAITSGAAVTFDSLTGGAGTFVQILGTSLTVGDATNTTVASVISGTGDLVKVGAGVLTLSGANTYVGATSVTSGTLQLGGSIASSVNVAVGATLRGSGTITGDVSSLGTVTPGQLTITGNLTSTGTVQFTVNSGWTIVGTDYTQLSVGGNLDLSNSTLSILNTNDTTAPLINQLIKLINHTGTANKTIINGATLPTDAATLAVGTHSFKLFYNGGDGNDVVLVEASTPSVVYVSNTAWTSLTPGISILDADLGTLLNQPAIFGVNAFASVSAALAASSSSSQVIVNAGTYHEAVSMPGTNTLTITGGAAVTLDSLAAVSGTFVQILGTSLTIGNATNTTVAGLVSGAGNLIKAGTGSLTLSGTNTYTGTTSIAAGTVVLANSNALGATAAGTIVTGGAMLDLNGKAIGAESLSLSGSGLGGIGVVINSDTTNGASLSGNVTLVGDAAIGGPGNLTFSGTVNGAASNSQSLNFVGAGAKRFTNVIGGTNALASLTQDDASGSLELDQNLTVGSATLNANVILDGMTFASTGNITIGNSAADTLSITGSATTVQSSSGSIVLNSTTNAHQNLTLTGVSLVSDLSVNGAIVGDSGVTLALNAGRTVAISAEVSTTGAGAITVSGNGGTGARNIIVNGPAIVSVVDGNITFDADRSVSSSGDFSGISVGAATIRATGVGSVSMTGRGGNDPTTGSHSGISIAAGGQVTSANGNLTLVGFGGVGLATNFGVSIAGSVGTTGSGTVSVTGTGGSGTDGYGIAVASGGLVATNGQQISFVADSMLLDGSINAGTASVSLTQKTNNTLIDLGGSDVIGINPAVLGLSDAELNHVTAGTITIGNASSGAITVSSDIHLKSPSPVSTLVLTSSGTVTAATGGILVNNLAITAGGAVAFSSGTSQVSNLGILATSGSIRFVTADSINVTTVAGVAGLDSSNSSADITLTAGGLVNLIQAVKAGGGTVRIATTNGGVNQTSTGAISAATLGVTNQGTGDVLLTAVNNVNLFAASNTAPGGAVKLLNAHGITIGTVAGDGFSFAAVSGIATAGGDITLAAGGALIIDDDVTAGIGTVRIATATGGVSQGAGDTIVAGAVGINNAGSGTVILNDSNQMGLIAIANPLGGRVSIQNAGPLIVGAVSADGTIFSAVSGITVGDGTHPGGNVAIESNGSLSVLNAIRTTGGNINLQASGATADVGIKADLTTTGGNGNVTLRAGRNIEIFDAGLPPEIKVDGTGVVTLNAQSQVIFNPDVVVQTSTGAIAGAPPLITNIQTPQISALGDASVSFDFGRPGEHNFTITVDWGDGTIQTLPTFADPGRLSLQHMYISNPDKTNPAAPIEIKIKVVQDPAITVLANNISQNTTVSSSLASVPGTGLNAYVADLAPPVAYLTIPEAQKIGDRIQISGTQLNDVSSLRIDSVRSDDLVASERQVVVEILAPDGLVQQRIVLPESVLDDSLEIIRKLPDGNYRFQLQEPGEERQRLLLEFEVRQGKIVNSNDESYRPPSSTKGKVGPAPDANPTPPAPPEVNPEGEDSAMRDDVPVADALIADHVNLDSTHPAARMLDDGLAPSRDGWSSLAVQQAWRRAERAVESIVDTRGVSSDEQSPSDEQSAEISDPSVQMNPHDAAQGSAIVVGAAVSVIGNTHHEIGQGLHRATAQLSRAARLLRKYTRGTK